VVWFIPLGEAAAGGAVAVVDETAPGVVEQPSTTTDMSATT
jgi:hypothetical protein